ncbi:ion channel protein [Pseudalgibacter alginicilyticus]|uniref:Ion channel protein n=1 Tax=Pseudalgibacter alginicilyticus TaxID=1736674 RepID=A0A0P0CHR2_9FLAO|nr:tetratricopeptide repeat protein [Pseudalgibacter alginicilyticus]ALJ05719.1 ion channel protein [Pseudalgibacter alginicilyticus]
MKQTFYILILLFCSVLNAQNDVIFEKANTLYNEGKYAEAIDTYKNILDTKHHSAALYFNLANAHYKLNNIAPSIYYYEKALQLEPNDQDIKNNLAFANNMTIDAIDTVPEAGLKRLLNKTTNIMSFDTWAIMAIVSVFCSVILFLMYYFAYSTLKKRLSFIGSFVFLAWMLISLSFAFHNYNLVQKDKPAIIFANESKVKSEPNTRSEESFRLHEGTKVQVLETVDDWKKIKLADGKTGWIETKDIKAL